MRLKRRIGAKATTFETCWVLRGRQTLRQGAHPKAGTLKLIFDRRTQKLLGGQIVSDSDSAVKEIDTINALILGEKTIPELTTLMCAGTPDCSSEPSLEPITICAEQALQKLWI